MTKGPFMEFLRNKVQETANSTFTEEEIPTPCSNTEKMAMLIHMIAFHTDDPQTDEGSYGTVLTGIYRHSMESPVHWHDPDCIMSYTQMIAAGRYEGTLSEYFEYYADPQVLYFDPPILYARSVIYHSVEGIGQPGVAVKTSHVMIGYTLEKVSDAHFIAALVE